MKIVTKNKTTSPASAGLFLSGKRPGRCTALFYRLSIESLLYCSNDQDKQIAEISIKHKQERMEKKMDTENLGLILDLLSSFEKIADQETFETIFGNLGEHNWREFSTRYDGNIIAFYRMRDLENQRLLSKYLSLQIVVQ